MFAASTMPPLQQKPNYGGNGFGPTGGASQQSFFQQQQQQAPIIQQPYGGNNNMNAVFGSNNDQVDFFGSILTPQQSNMGYVGQAPPANKPLMTGDLDSSLAALADSLTIKPKWDASPAKPAAKGAGRF
jgi:hypothetical protein